MIIITIVLVKFTNIGYPQLLPSFFAQKQGQINIQNTAHISTIIQEYNPIGY